MTSHHRRIHRWWSRRPRWQRRSVCGLLSGAVLGTIVLAASVTWTRVESHGDVYSPSAVPAAPVGLVLGDLVYADGQPSEFLLARLAIARRLYATGKVRVLLVSGDNSRRGYDEPDVMRTWLVDHGVPGDKVVAGYAGFDTYASCVRAHVIFGVRQAIIVSQSYHLPRAITICRREGIRATGVGDSSVSVERWTWWRAVVREQFADVKAAADVTLSRRPVLGPKESGVTRALAASR
jgi:vancomycin permeability regulator SanA